MRVIRAHRIAHAPRQAPTALVFITHDLAVAYQVSDHVAVMREGRVVESGLTGQVIAEPQHSYTKMLIAASEDEILEEEPT